MDESVKYLFETSNAVFLGEKSSVLFKRLFSILVRFEKQNEIFEKFSFYFGTIITVLKSFFKR
jgi:hypothetical protein